MQDHRILSYISQHAAMPFPHMPAIPLRSMYGERLMEDDAMLQVMHEELAEELVVTPELVLTVLSPLEAALVDWFKAQAPETLKDRLSKEEFQVGGQARWRNAITLT